MYNATFRSFSFLKIKSFPSFIRLKFGKHFRIQRYTKYILLFFQELWEAIQKTGQTLENNIFNRMEAPTHKKQMKPND